MLWRIPPYWYFPCTQDVTATRFLYVTIYFWPFNVLLVTHWYACLTMTYFSNIFFLIIMGSLRDVAKRGLNPPLSLYKEACLLACSYKVGTVLSRTKGRTQYFDINSRYGPQFTSTCLINLWMRNITMLNGPLHISTMSRKLLSHINGFTNSFLGWSLMVIAPNVESNATICF